MKILKVEPNDVYEESKLREAQVRIITEKISGTFEFDLAYFYHRACEALAIDTSTMTLTKLAQSLMTKDGYGGNIPVCTIFKQALMTVEIRIDSVGERFTRNEKAQPVDNWSIEEGYMLRGIAKKGLKPTLVFSVFATTTNPRTKFLPIDDPKIKDVIFDKRGEILKKF